jgi:hypothetical protein
MAGTRLALLFLRYIGTRNLPKPLEHTAAGVYTWAQSSPNWDYLDRLFSEGSYLASRWTLLTGSHETPAFPRVDSAMTTQAKGKGDEDDGKMSSRL